jgi:ComF family protein
MKHFISEFTQQFADAFYPADPYCPSCGRVLLDTKTIICHKCAPHVFKPLKFCMVCGRAVKGGQICSICYENKHTYDAGISMFEYNDYTAPMIQSIKYNNNTVLAYRLGALLALDIERKSNILTQTHMIISVPLHENRLKQRGYNQAQLIAQGLVSQSGIEIKNDVLIKIKETKDQIGLSKYEREENLKDCFLITDSMLVKNKNILIVDDVLTTASTVNTCAKILKKEGAGKIFFAVLASKTY